ncbi:uncharacterized protein [Parasteatoda tepidariorum]|uniref:uncharacterized protein n=1 Tax=Parasteatoda tepidariorum TaxID=114398 RepID=UPI0039BC988B
MPVIPNFRDNFLPTFAQRGVPRMTQMNIYANRRSLQGRDSKTKKVISLSQNVKLHEADNVPSYKQDAASDQIDLEVGAVSVSTAPTVPQSQADEQPLSPLPAAIVDSELLSTVPLPGEILSDNSPQSDISLVEQQSDSLSVSPTTENEDKKNVNDPAQNKTKQSNKLKYSYKEDQWSPVNIEGKKKYDRDFLLQLQCQPSSLVKPQNLPNLDVIKNKAHIQKLNEVNRQVQQMPVMPNFRDHFLPTFAQRGVPRMPQMNNYANRRSLQGRDSKTKKKSSTEPRNTPHDVNTQAVAAQPEKFPISDGMPTAQQHYQSMAGPVYNPQAATLAQQCQQMHAKPMAMPYQQRPFSSPQDIIFPTATNQPVYLNNQWGTPYHNPPQANSSGFYQSLPTYTNPIQPAQQISQQPAQQTQKKTKALAIIDPATGKNIFDGSYNEDSSRSTPEKEIYQQRPFNPPRNIIFPAATRQPVYLNNQWDTPYNNPPQANSNGSYQSVSTYTNPIPPAQQPAQTQKKAKARAILDPATTKNIFDGSNHEEISRTKIQIEIERLRRR